MARTIRVDDEVYALLQGQARPFEDTPNSVLRRVLDLDTVEPQQATAANTPMETDAQPVTQKLTPQGKAVMSKLKFDEFDRERTIKAVEQHFDIKLLKTGSRRKIFH